MNKHKSKHRLEAQSIIGLAEMRRIMKFVVNENCIGCGLCASTCPNVFEMTDDGVAHAIEQDVDASLEADAQSAMESCPVAAIEQV